MIKAIALDAFGTLVHITDRRNNPMKRMIEAAISMKGVDVRYSALRFPNVLAELEHHLDADLFAELNADLQMEVASVQAFPESIEVITRLNEKYPVYIASNLAAPYCEPIRQLFGSTIKEYFFSCNIGAVKPESRFYDYLAMRAVVDPSEIMMIGDNYKNDFEGAESSGYNSAWLNREQQNLLELVEELQFI